MDIKPLDPVDEYVLVLMNDQPAYNYIRKYFIEILYKEAKVNSVKVSYIFDIACKKAGTSARHLTLSQVVAILIEMANQMAESLAYELGNTAEEITKALYHEFSVFLDPKTLKQQANAHMANAADYLKKVKQGLQSYIADLKDIAWATITYFNEDDISKQSEDNLIAAIKQVEKELKDFGKIKSKSSKIEAIKADLTTGLKTIAQELDTR